VAWTTVAQTICVAGVALLLVRAAIGGGVLARFDAMRSRRTAG
jgi:hypothetical protein